LPQTLGAAILNFKRAVGRKFGDIGHRMIFKAVNGKAIVLLSSILFLATGCGVKSNPIPWELVVPKRIVDLRGVSREGRILLEWTAPKENTDKSVLVDLVEFKILRSEGALVAGECRGCGESSKVVYETKVAEKEDARGKKMSVLLEDLEAKKVYVFTVVSVIERTSRRSIESSPDLLDHPPPPPRRVQGEGADKR